MLIALNVVPTIILAAIIYLNSYWLGDDLIKLKDKNTIESIFYSTCFSIMGFNVLASLSSLFIHSNAPPETIVKTPMMYIYAVLFSPIFEELICRRFILIKINKYFNWWIAAIVSSIIFSALHFSIPLFMSYFFIGLVWSYYYRKSNYNIFVPILSHFLFNYFAILIQSLKG